jgi:hypothetical protein
MDAKPDFDARRALSFNPFQGDETDVTVLSDRIVTGAKAHPRCQICEGEIKYGERHRARTEKNNEGSTPPVMTFRFCGACCVAMADPDTYDTGRLIEARYSLGEQRRKDRKNNQ